jgi:hypothetical protein
MNYQQLVTPNPNVIYSHYDDDTKSYYKVNCWPGWCLEYVAQTFGGKFSNPQPNATLGFDVAQYKHTDLPPSGIWSVIWFAVKGVSEGHVALSAPDGTVYSSSHPTSHTATHHPSFQALLNYYGGILTYRGWTEDLQGLRIIEGGNMQLNKTAWQELAHGILGRNGLSGRSNALDGSSDNSDYIGRELDLDLINELFISDEAKKWRDSNDYGSVPDINKRLVSVSTVQQQLTDAQTKNVGLTQNLSDQNAQLDVAHKQIAELQNELGQKPAPIAPDQTPPPKVSFWQMIINLFTRSK